MSIQSSNPDSNKQAHSWFDYRRLGIFASILLVGLSLFWAWRLYHHPGIQIPIPAEINDLEVRGVIEKAKTELIARPTAANWGYLGMVLSSHQYDSEALLCFREAHERDPGDSRWPFLLGLSLNRRDPNQGLDFLEKAFQSNTWPNYQFGIGITLVEKLLEQDRFDEAKKYLEKIKSEGGDRDRYQMCQAWMALHHGDNDLAEELFSRIQKNPCARYRATAQLATLARLANQPDKAAQYEKDLLQIPLDKEWPDPLFHEIINLRVGKAARENRIKLLEEKQQFREAASLYLKELESDRSINNLMGAGQNLMLGNQFAQAEKLFQEILQGDPQNARARHFLAMCFYGSALAKQKKNGNAREIEAEFLECEKQAALAIQNKPNLAHAYQMQALALKNLQRPQEAIVVLKEGLRHRPETFDLRYSLAELLFEQKKLDEAREEIMLAIGADHKNPKALQLQKQIELALQKAK